MLSVIKYAENDDKTDKQLFVSTINCPRQRPYECMMATKRRFGKTNGIVAYHGFQSFRGGEDTPEEAHQIGIQTAKRMWKDKYEVVITTHLDHESHYHNHFVANSVSRLDGSRFQNHHYDHLHLREISDAVCAEDGKSVLKDSKFWGRNKTEYWAHKNGKLSHRDNLSEERFSKMSKAYEAEQGENKKKIELLSEQIKSETREIDTTKMFLDIVENTTHLEKLTAEVVRNFIDKIVVHHRKEENGITTQKIEIYHNVIGKFEVPSNYVLPTASNLTEAKAMTATLGTPA